MPAEITLVNDYGNDTEFVKKDLVELVNCNYQDRRIILVTKDSVASKKTFCGIVIFTGQLEESKLLEYSKDWTKDMFKPFYGSICINSLGKL